MTNDKFSDPNQEILSLKPPAIPKRSRLFSLSPEGVGTPYTESLTSYLNRLAKEHCLTPRQLIMSDVAPLMVSKNFDTSFRNKKVSSVFANSDAKPALNGMKAKTQNLTQVMSDLTQRRDIKFLSFLSWKGIIDDRNLFRQYRAWCPQCFEQWRQEQKIIYEPLLWSLREVDYCPSHNCKLINECPHCHFNLPVIANYLQIGYCSNCKLWLGNKMVVHENIIIKIDSEDIQWNQYKINALGELIGISNKLSFSFTLQELIQKLQIILLCCGKAVNQDLTKFIPLGKLMEQLKINIIQHSDKPVNLIKLIIPICYQINLSITQLFLEDLEGFAQLLVKNFNLSMQFYKC